MSNLILQSVMLFSPIQLAVLIIMCLLFASLVAFNIVLAYVFHKRGARKLCTHQLQQKREELLLRLKNIRQDSPQPDDGFDEPEEGFEEEAELDEDTDEEDDDKEDGGEEQTYAIGTVIDDPESVRDAEIIAVAEMSDSMRERFGLSDAEYDGKRYYARYKYGFEANLRTADDAVKQAYKAFADEVALYKGLKIKGGFTQQSIVKGHKTLGLIMFRGGELCAAFALDPAEYANTKYRGIDKSGKKRFAETPMLIKLNSERKIEYAKYLLVQIADKNTIVMEDLPEYPEYDLAEKTRGELIAENSARIEIIGEVAESPAESADESSADGNSKSADESNAESTNDGSSEN